jgi:hypothetical protein
MAIIKAVPEFTRIFESCEKRRLLEENATWHQDFWVQQFWNRCSRALSPPAF